MKKQLKKLRKNPNFGLYASLAAAIVGIALLRLSFASSNQFVLSTPANNITKGESFVVSALISPGNMVDGVEAVITYDSSKLEFASINYEGSAFPLELDMTQINGKIVIVRGILGDKVSGSDSVIANITFNSLAKNGSTDITLAGNATDAGAYTNPVSDTASINFGGPSKGGGGNKGGGGGDNKGGGGGSDKEKNPKSPKWQ